jgi:hypothetical protein
MPTDRMKLTTIDTLLRPKKIAEATQLKTAIIKKAWNGTPKTSIPITVTYP